MLNDLLEIIFENIHNDKINSLLKILINSYDDIINYNIIEFDNNSTIIDLNSYEKLLNNLVDYFKNKNIYLITFNVKRLFLNEIEFINNCNITFRKKSDDSVNLEIDFYQKDSSIISVKLFIEALFNFSINFSKKNNLNSFFCGRENANDDFNQLFKNQEYRKYYYELNLN